MLQQVTDDILKLSQYKPEFIKLYYGSKIETDLNIFENQVMSKFEFDNKRLNIGH